MRLRTILRVKIYALLSLCSCLTTTLLAPAALTQAGSASSPIEIGKDKSRNTEETVESNLRDADLANHIGEILAEVESGKKKDAIGLSGDFGMEVVDSCNQIVLLAKENNTAKIQGLSAKL